MRLIDADELIKDIEYSADMGGVLGKVVECVKYYAKYMVASAPTIEERKTGKWISDMDDEPVVIKDGSPDKSCHCSECGEWLVASDEYDIKGNFCPNCGADMRGEGHE